MATSGITQLYAIVVRFKERHPLLKGDKTGKCKSVSISLLEELECKGYQADVQYGYYLARNAWHKHCWVEVAVDATNYVVDLTADQFGETELLFGPANQFSGRLLYHIKRQRPQDYDFDKTLLSIPFHGTW